MQDRRRRKERREGKGPQGEGPSGGGALQPGAGTAPDSGVSAVGSREEAGSAKAEPRPEPEVPPISRTDRWVAAVCGLFSFAVYVYTLAPNVTLEDSGEFITAAMHFGVPHPPGYPSWTALSWLFATLIPFGNVAWRVNLVSATCGGLAVGTFCLLMIHSARWLMRGIRGTTPAMIDRLAPIGAAVGSLSLAFSDVMWSQSVIAEVYTLNALFLALTVWSFYWWMLHPGKLFWLAATAFLLALGLSNHHTLLFIFPAFFLGVWIVRREIFWSFVAGVTLVSSSVLAYFAGLAKKAPDTLLGMPGGDAAGWLFALAIVAGLGMLIFRPRDERRCWLAFCAALFVLTPLLGVYCGLSGDAALVETAQRVCFVALLAVAGMAVVFEFRLHWKLIGTLFVAVWLGLAIYAYMPFASSTNPPMNWGFASEKTGFFHAINRGQYANNMATTIKQHLAPLVGVSTPKPADDPLKAKMGFWQKLSGYASIYVSSLEANFTWAVIFVAMCSLLYAGHFSPKGGQWMWVTLGFFLLMSILQMFIMEVNFDEQSQWVNKTFFLQSQCIFAMWVAYGATFGLLYLVQTVSEGALLWAPVALVLPLLPMWNNYSGCEQRGHWFGWMYGTDMLRDVDRDAVIFGGTDPGRFVPTYTIFCESAQNPRWKRDKDFNRLDLYIITQNALADNTYMKYIRGHYDESRRTKYGWFERWLGRDEMYPKEPIKIPNDEEVARAFGEYVRQSGQQVKPGQRVVVEGIAGVFAINGMISKMIFDKNKDKHSFYVEESFPMDWYYPHAVPHGLFLKIEKDPVGQLPKEKVDADRKFWDAYSAKLQADKKFLHDRPARMSFAKLRSSIANIYAFRQMWPEAEYAYRQALSLAPQNSEVVFRLSEVMVRLERFDEALDLVRKFQATDPYNIQVPSLLKSIEERRSLLGAKRQIEAKSAGGTATPQERFQLVVACAQLGAWTDFDKSVDNLIALPGLGAGDLKQVASLCAQHKRTDAIYRVMRVWSRVDTGNAALFYDIAALAAMRGETNESREALAKAIQIGGDALRNNAARDGRFAPYRGVPGFSELLGGGAPAAPAPAPGPVPGGVPVPPSP